ncbi:MAG TPA: D-arabinono-1,4-lactone oxidase [Gammaproteobacteria bacterium]|nr:D-arabinono-1,4-lactone oxidase [Gammaproteobacteria bacterium]
MQSMHDTKEIPNENNIHYPRNIDELKQIISYAKTHHLSVRAFGSEHSPPASIYSESKDQIKIILDDEFRKIHSFAEDQSKTFAITKVGAGCNLGVNPSDKKHSSLENSFNYQIHQKGYALPNLGGISHQTIAGFLQTSSSGGSAKHNISDVILEIEWVNGKGELCVAKQGEDLFNAVAVSMGLFGVITSVTFKLVPKFMVQGTEVNKELDDSYLAKDENNSHSALDQALFANEDNEYIHLNWFPQKYVRRVTQWRGKSTSQDDKIVPYHHPLESHVMSALAATVFIIGNQLATIGTELAQRLLGILMKPFVLLGDSQEFCDDWYKILPIDDQAPVDHLASTSFSELWFPREQINTVLDTLKTIVAESPEAAGNFMIEIYCAKKSPFWLSPSEGRDSLRVDLYWYDYNLVGNANHYFGLFWEKLMLIPGVRLHWGKFLPNPFERYGQLDYDPSMLQKNYAKLPEFLAFRENMDPDQLFVTPYWRKVLSIPALIVEEKPVKVGFFAVNLKTEVEESKIQKTCQM